MSDPGLRSDNAWALVYEGFEPGHEGHREALCTLGNGYLATRGAWSDTDADGTHYPGTYVAGVFNQLESEVAGHQVIHESIVNVPNWLPVAFRPSDGEWSAPSAAEPGLRQTLDLRTGILQRTRRVGHGDGRFTRVEERRIVSMAAPHLAALELRIVPENWSGALVVRAGIDGRVVNANVGEDRFLEHRHLRTVSTGCVAPDTAFLESETTRSHVRVAIAMRTRLVSVGETPVWTAVDEGDWVGLETCVAAVAGEPVVVTKFAAVATTRDHATASAAEAALAVLGDADLDLDTLVVAHTHAWVRLWERCRLDLDGADAHTTLTLRLHVFHLLQTLSPHVADLDVGVPARGLHGEGYRGHVFWDELFVFPFLNVRFPELTRALLLYRKRRLPAARRQARALGLRGARFPWQSATTGAEQTPTSLYNPRSERWVTDNSCRQHHVGLAVAYNVWQYHQTTGDLDFLREHGAELLVEIARFWTGLATYDAARDRYDIRGVMGPDEYHDGYPDRPGHGVDNNTYTNVLVSWLLQRVGETRALLDHHDTDRQLWERLDVTSAELSHWAQLSRHLEVPFTEAGVLAQFEGWDRLDELDWERYRRRYGNIERLDLILEAEGDTTNRYQVSKQADVLMLFYLFSADELDVLFDHLGYRLDRNAIPATVEHYLARTTNGSTLSRLVSAWVLARGDRSRSWQVFRDALAADLDDTQGGTTREGIHLGAMAGGLDLLQRCYSGLETRGDALWFDPHLPDELTSLSYDLVYRGHTLGVTITHERLTITARACDAGPVHLQLPGRALILTAGDTAEVSLSR